MVRLGHGGVLGSAEMVFRFYDADSAECSGEGGGSIRTSRGSRGLSIYRYHTLERSN